MDLTRQALALDWSGSITGAAMLVIWDAYGWGARRRVPGRRPGTVSRSPV